MKKSTYSFVPTFLSCHHLFIELSVQQCNKLFYCMNKRTVFLTMSKYNKPGHSNFFHKIKRGCWMAETNLAIGLLFSGTDQPWNCDNYKKLIYIYSLFREDFKKQNKKKCPYLQRGSFS